MPPWLPGYTGGGGGPALGIVGSGGAPGPLKPIGGECGPEPEPGPAPGAAIGGGVTLVAGPWPVPICGLETGDPSGRTGPGNGVRGL